MTKHHPVEDRLQDWVAGVVSADIAAAVGRHVMGCAVCRERVESLRDMLDQLARLPREIRPDRDLRSGIWHAIDESESAGRSTPDPHPSPGIGKAMGGTDGSRQETAGGVRRVRTAIRPRTLLAAAVVLVAITAGLSVAVDRKLGGRRPAPTLTEQTKAAVLAAESRFDRAARELEQLVAGQRATLSPATRQVLDRSLGVIDGAVDDARTALEADPGNEMLYRMLIAAYEKKLAVLRTASRAPVGI